MRAHDRNFELIIYNSFILTPIYRSSLSSFRLKQVQCLVCTGLNKLQKYNSITECMLTGVSVSAVMCSDSACRSISGESSTILCTDIWMNSSKESNCCRTRPFSSKYELMTIQQASCHRSRVISSPSSSPYPTSRGIIGKQGKSMLFHVLVESDQ